MDDGQAAHDPLTGLGNRRVFHHQLAAAVVGALLSGHTADSEDALVLPDRVGAPGAAGVIGAEPGR